MGNVYTDQNHNGNKIIDADLTQIGPELLHPDLLVGTEVLAGPGIAVAQNGDGTVTISSALTASSYRQQFNVIDPDSQAPLVVNHNLGARVVSVTVAELTTPARPIDGYITLVDDNTLEVLLTGEPQGSYEVLVISDSVGQAAGAALAQVQAEVAALRAEVAALRAR